MMQKENTNIPLDVFVKQLEQTEYKRRQKNLSDLKKDYSAIILELFHRRILTKYNINNWHEIVSQRMEKNDTWSIQTAYWQEQYQLNTFDSVAWMVSYCQKSELENKGALSIVYSDMATIVNRFNSVILGEIDFITIFNEYELEKETF